MGKKILVAFDSYKGSLSSIEIGKEIAKQITNCKIISISDGGEGFVDSILFNNKNVKREILKTCDDLNKPIEISVGIKGNEAYIDIASIVALNNYKNVSGFKKTSRGIGVILNKLETNKLINKVYIGLGGSSTVDGGFYASLEMGFKYLDSNGKEILKIQNIEKTQKVIFPKLKNQYIGLADVKNPLLGKKGALNVYGKQKWLSKGEMTRANEHLEKFASLFKLKNAKAPGSGAAGGLGYLILNHLKGKLKPGLNELLDLSLSKKLIKKSDWIITGEGKFDKQSFYGKVPVEISKIAGKNKTILVAGIIDANESIVANNFKYYFQLKKEDQSLEEAMQKTKSNLRDVAKKIKKIIF